MALESPEAVANNAHRRPGGTEFTSSRRRFPRRWRSRRCAWASRCCSGAEPGTSKTALAEGGRRSPSACGSHGCGAPRGSTLTRRSTTGTSPARSCTCTGAPGHRRRLGPWEPRRSLCDDHFPCSPLVLQGRSRQARRCCWSTGSTGPTEASSGRSCSGGAVDLSLSIPISARCAATPPVVVLTSSRTPQADALKLPLPLDRHPGLERGSDPGAGRRRCRRPCAGRSSRSSSACATRDDLQKPPGVAETLDWARALQHLGSRGDRPGGGASGAAALVGRWDAERVRRSPGPDAASAGDDTP